MKALIDVFQEYNSNGSIYEAIRIHLILTGTVVLCSALTGFVTGFLATQRKLLSTTLSMVVAILQSIPTLAFFGLLIPFTGIGFSTAVIVLSAFAILPIYNATFSSLSAVDSEYLEIAKGLGLSERTIFRKIKFPLSLPYIISGIRVAFITTIASATLATLIGAGGLGDIIYAGLQSRSFTLTLVGVIPLMIISLVVSLLLTGLERYTKKRINAL